MVKRKKWGNDEKNRRDNNSGWHRQEGRWFTPASGMFVYTGKRDVGLPRQKRVSGLFCWSIRVGHSSQRRPTPEIRTSCSFPCSPGFQAESPCSPLQKGQKREEKNYVKSIIDVLHFHLAICSDLQRLGSSCQIQIEYFPFNSKYFDKNI